MGSESTPAGESPAFVKTSLAGAITLGLRRGRFHRGARLGCLNLLLTYAGGCLGRCSYCGLSRDRRGAGAEPTFIRVGWPTFPLDRVLERARRRKGALCRVCVAMVTRPEAFEGCREVVRRVRGEAGLPVSVLLAPTAVAEGERLLELRRSGADCLGIAVDAATPELFDRHRGRGVGGPHRWERYWEAVSQGVRAFGPRRVSVHLIVGLGETEQEMVRALQRVWDAGAVPHLFSFFPEPGSALAGRPQPAVDRYRRIQLARHLVVERGLRAEEMGFDGDGRLVALGADPRALLADGEAFRTSGCPGPDGRTACNRPFGNERPGGVLYNYPFPLDRADMEAVARELAGFADPLGQGAGGSPCPGR
ncbi:MAG: radical SAM protein [Deferrisomatales bacterium]